MLRDATMTGAMSVRNDPASLASVRRELILDLTLHGADERAADDAALVISELMGNALRHGGVAEGGDLDVSWTIHGRDVLVCVEDLDVRLPRREVAPHTATSGRGLTIVEALSTDWGYERTRDGKRVWAVVPLHAA